MSSGQPYTAGSWLVSAGREDEFVAAWTEFTTWSLDHANGADSFVLLRDVANPLRFLSFGAWTDADAVAGWRGSHGFASGWAGVGRCARGFEGRDYTAVAQKRR